jgi:hypothetical protein
MAIWNDRWFARQAMPPNSFPQHMMCENLVRKIMTGASLEDAEKSHLAVCEACMAEVVRMLDESAASKPLGHGMVADGTNGDLTQVRPEAKKALEQGRRVFEGEFGISLTKK